MSEAIRLPEPAAPRRPIPWLGDRQLVRSAARGDRRALGAICERYHQQLYRYCRSITGSEEEARDALQNTMARVIQSLPGERRDLALKPWLFRIAHNESVELLRRSRPHSALSDALEMPGPTLEQELSTREQLRQLASDLAGLPERQRGALLMRELSGLSYDEIATTFETTPAVAKQAVYEARRALHELAEGRDMDCESVRKLISERDRRMLRGRRIRAHLDGCVGCRDFRRGIEARRTQLAALAPPLPGVAVASIFSTLGIGSGGGGSGMGGLLSLAGAGTGKAVGAGTMAKVAAVVAVTGGVGAGAIETGVLDDEKAPASREVTQQARPSPGTFTAPNADRNSEGNFATGRPGHATEAADGRDRRRREESRTTRFPAPSRKDERLLPSAPAAKPAAPHTRPQGGRRRPPGAGEQQAHSQSGADAAGFKRPESPVRERGAPPGRGSQSPADGAAQKPPPPPKAKPGTGSAAPSSSRGGVPAAPGTGGKSPVMSLPRPDKG